MEIHSTTQKGNLFMNEKEISEIRRRFRPDKNNITHICGCYVNDKQEIVSEFNQSLALMPQEESEKLLTILRKTLSGVKQKNLIDITFSTQQVVNSEEHQLLMASRDSSLKDHDVIHYFYEKVIQTISFPNHYLILLAYDVYDVPYRSKDGEKQEDASSEIFSYILCSICPVKLTKPALCYDIPENLFRNLKTDWIVSPPELGFLFPAFDDRCANIYNALFYSRNSSENHEAFISQIFCTEIPRPAQEQKEAFQTVLQDSLTENCNYEVVQTIHEQLCEMIEEHKTNKETEPLMISKETVHTVLQSCGVPEQQISIFDEKYDSEFGAETYISPRNLVETNRFEVKTPDITIRVNPERSDLVETRVIDGKKYILIRAEEGVEVNGVTIQIF